MREVGKNQHQNYWVAALEAKFEGKGDEYGRKEFDKFLSDYAGVADYPAAIFADELSKAYPDAKVILTVRDEDKWYESMMATIIHAYNKPNYQERSPMSKLANIYHAHLWGNDFPKNGRARFRENNEHVRVITPKENLLEYEVKDGWKPLCAFLGKEVPDLPFPRSDDWADYKRENGTGAGISKT